MTDQELLGTLQDLGLTKYQSKAYIAAVRAGRTRPSKLVDESGVPQGRIYDVINNLEDLGLLEVRSGSNGKEVTAPSPQTVLEELKQRRIDELSDTVSMAASDLEELHQWDESESSDFVSMVKREETALRHSKRAIEAAEYWLTLCVSEDRYDKLEPALVEAANRGVTVRVLLIGTDPKEIGKDFPETFDIRYRATADMFVVADCVYGVYSSKRPTQNHQPYIIAQEQNLVLLFQNYGEQVWQASKVVQEVAGFPRRYLDPWRTIIDLRERFIAGDDITAIVEGRRTDARETGTWEGSIVDFDVGGPADVDYMILPPTYASLTLETTEGQVKIGGWKATLEDVAATGIEIRMD